MQQMNKNLYLLTARGIISNITVVIEQYTLTFCSEKKKQNLVNAYTFLYGLASLQG